MEEFSNHCRFCSSNGIFELDIFQQNKESNSSIAEDLFKLCNIQLVNTEGLPTKICTNCNLKVTNLKDFLTNLNKTQQMLLEFQNYLNKTKENCKLNFSKNQEIDNLGLSLENFLEGIGNSNYKSESKDYVINNSFQENEKPKVPNIPEGEYLNYFESIEQSDDSTQNIELEINREALKDAPSNLKKNNDYNKSNKMIDCELCGEKCSNQRVLSVHKKKEHVNEISFEDPDSSKKHNENYSRTGVKIYKCNLCDRICTSRAGLTLHKKKHEEYGDEDYDCENSKDEDYEPPKKKEKEYLCPHCDRKFTSVNGRWAHIYTVHDKSMRVMCDECGKEFPTKYHLVKHKVTHKEIKDLQCPHCPAKFKRQSNLYVHKAIHGESFSCEICGAVLNTKKLLKQHMIVHSDVKKYKCNFCDKNFKRARNLYSHVETHVAVRVFQCCSCNMRFVTYQTYRSHLKNSHPEKFDEMIAKGERISTSNALSSEQLKAINDARKKDKNYKYNLASGNLEGDNRENSDSCHESESINDGIKNILYNDGKNESSGNLEATNVHNIGSMKQMVDSTEVIELKTDHDTLKGGFTVIKKKKQVNEGSKSALLEKLVKKEENENLFEDTCKNEDRFTNDNLYSEITNDPKVIDQNTDDFIHPETLSEPSEHNENVKKASVKIYKYKCNLCDRNFITKSGLSSHTKAHNRPVENEYLCPHCDRKYTTKEGRWAHIYTVHDNSRAVICDECGKEFPTKQHLAKHKVIHKVIKDIQCPLCPAKFKRQSNLYVHKAIHGESFSCEICGAVLNTKKLLKQHLMVHSDEKKYKCNFCDKNFTRARNLYSHVETHVAVRAYQCCSCDKSFVQYMTYRTHLKKCHPKKFYDMIAKGDRISTSNPFSSEQLKAINDARKKDKNYKYNLVSGDAIEHLEGDNRENSDSCHESESINDGIKNILCDGKNESSGNLEATNVHNIGSMKQIVDSTEDIELKTDHDTLKGGFTVIKKKKQVNEGSKSALLEKLVKKEENENLFEDTCENEEHFTNDNLYTEITNDPKVNDQNTDDFIHPETLSEPSEHNENVKKASVKIYKYKCNLCDRNFISKSGLNSHTKAHNRPVENEYLCPHCDRKYTTKEGRWAHIYTVHDNSRAVICDECGKECPTKQRLAKHKVIHKVIKDIQCPLCPAKFKSQSNLYVHKAIHGESFSCEICGAVLNTKKLLKQHMMVHSDEKKYKCNFCDKNFTRARNLYSHVETHVAVRAYQCCSCDKSFVQYMTYRTHLKKCHPEKFYDMIAKGDRISTSNAFSSDQLRAINDAAKKDENYKYGKKTKKEELSENN